MDTVGKKDIPAIVDKVLQISKHEKMHYIGFMEGATVFFIMASKMPEYNQKVINMMAMGPHAYVGHSTNKMMHTMAEKEGDKSV